MRSADVACVAGELRAGRPAIFPTDTVYGLGVSVLHAGTPQVLYDLKRRDAGKPIAWLVGGPEALDAYGVGVPPEAHALVRENWPGALTVIVRAGAAVPSAFASAQGTIGLRMPASEEALALIAAVGGPLATTSANLSGGPDPRSAEELDPVLVAQVRAALAGGAGTLSGVPSTVVDCSDGTVRILRQGAVRVEL